MDLLFCLLIYFFKEEVINWGKIIDRLKSFINKFILVWFIVFDMMVKGRFIIVV